MHIGVRAAEWGKCTEIIINAQTAKKEVQDNYEKCSLKYCPNCGARMDGGDKE